MSLSRETKDVLIAIFFAFSILIFLVGLSKLIPYDPQDGEPLYAKYPPEVQEDDDSRQDENSKSNAGRISGRAFKNSKGQDSGAGAF